MAIYIARVSTSSYVEDGYIEIISYALYVNFPREIHVGASTKYYSQSLLAKCNRDHFQSVPSRLLHYLYLSSLG